MINTNPDLKLDTNRMIFVWNKLSRQILANMKCPENVREVLEERTVLVRCNIVMWVIIVGFNSYSGWSSQKRNHQIHEHESCLFTTHAILYKWNKPLIWHLITNGSLSSICCLRIWMTTTRWPPKQNMNKWSNIIWWYQKLPPGGLP